MDAPLVGGKVRTREEQRDFRAALEQEHAATFGNVPLFCQLSLIDFPRANPLDIREGHRAHHISPWCLTQNNAPYNGILLSATLHRVIHDDANRDMGFYLRNTGHHARETLIDFVTPVTQAIARRNFDQVYNTRPELRRITLSTGERFLEAWEGLLLRKRLIARSDWR